MKLPNGIHQDTACMLIALREMIGDPNWEHPYLIENMRNNIGIGGKSAGFNGDVRELARLAGLWCEMVTILGRSTNDDYVTCHIEGKRVRFHRNTKIVIIFTMSSGNGHAECISFTLITSLIDAGMKIDCLILPRKGAIIDRI